MKIWYQTYAALGTDPKRRRYVEDLKTYVQTVARPDTQVAVHGVEKYAPKMNDSDYIQFMHIPQVIDKALQAEREGYDAFVLGGTLDLGSPYLREVLDIPVAFIAESSFYNACLLARKFGIISANEKLLRRQMELVKYHGLEQRCVPGVHLGFPLQEFGDLQASRPEYVTDIFTEAARKLISTGAGAIIPGSGAMGSSFSRQGIHDIDGVPIVDIVAAVVKTAEMLVDLKDLGVKRSRIGSYTYVSKEELMAARKLYGVE
ncbi:aspartate/glutamate racemase family protein [Chloroflexota bacterium]